jgi:hypothetical protein
MRAKSLQTNFSLAALDIVIWFLDWVMVYDDVMQDIT